MKSEYHKDDFGEWWGESNSPNHYVVFYYHRLDGPAVINKDGSVGYYLFDKLINKEKFETPGFIDSYILEHS